MLTQIYNRRDNKNMDDNMNNKENENENENTENTENTESTFGSSEYYKKLYNDFPEDVAEMLIGTHPLMKKEVSEELTHSIKIKSAREKNRRAVSDAPENVEETAENKPAENEAEPVSASKDPVEKTAEPEEEPELDNYVGDITNFTKGLVTPSSKRQRAESAPVKEEKEEAPKSEDDITAEKVARMLGGVDVEPVDEDELDDFQEDDYEERPKKKVKKEAKKEERIPRRKKQHKPLDEKDLELSNIDKQASLNELFREDDDYYEEKHSGNSVARIVIVIVAIVVLAFFIYKVASLSGQVSKLNEQIESYKTMETEYEQLKLDNLSLTEQVDNLQAQLGGGTTDSNSTTNNTTTGSESTTSSSSTSSGSSTTASSSSGARTYTVQAGDTYWGIATKMYGNGSYYEKILSANGLTENDKIREGMTLTIPAA